MHAFGHPLPLGYVHTKWMSLQNDIHYVLWFRMGSLDHWMNFAVMVRTINLQLYVINGRVGIDLPEDSALVRRFVLNWSRLASCHHLSFLLSHRPFPHPWCQDPSSNRRPKRERRRWAEWPKSISVPVWTKAVNEVRLTLPESTEGYVFYERTRELPSECPSF